MRQTIVVESSVNAEALTINRYRCLGWELVNNQEVAVSHNVSNPAVVNRYVKLTFERDTDSPNFAVLDGYYKQYCALEHHKSSINASANEKMSEKAVLLGALFAIIPSAIIGIIVKYEFLWEREIGNIIITAFLAFFLVWPCVFLFQRFIHNAKKKKNNFYEQIADIEAKIDAIVAESAKYI